MSEYPDYEDYILSGNAAADNAAEEAEERRLEAIADEHSYHDEPSLHQDCPLCHPA